jgi:hypothetical protein
VGENCRGVIANQVLSQLSYRPEDTARTKT